MADLARPPLPVAGALSWGEPAVILRCGLPAQAPTTKPCPAVNGVDGYLAAPDDAARSAYEHALAHRGKPFLGFRAAKGRLSVFPFSPVAVEAVAATLDGAAVSKGTVRFTPDRPLPDDVVRILVRRRIAEIESATPDPTQRARPTRRRL